MERARILIIEDEPRWRELLKEILQRDGYRVDVAETYAEARRRVETKDYRLAVVDIRLSESDTRDIQGMNLLEDIKQLGQQVYLIVVTAHGTVELSSQAFRKYGVLDFMDKKHFDPQQFRSLVQNSLVSMVHLVVQYGGQEDARTLKVGRENDLIVHTQSGKPTDGTYITLSLLQIEPGAELEVSVNVSFGMEVLPSTRQTLQLDPDGTSAPVRFKLVPEIVGKTEFPIEVYYRRRWLRALELKADVLQA